MKDDKEQPKPADRDGYKRAAGKEWEALEAALRKGKTKAELAAEAYLKSLDL